MLTVDIDLTQRDISGLSSETTGAIRGVGLPATNDDQFFRVQLRSVSGRARYEIPRGSGLSDADAAPLCRRHLEVPHSQEVPNGAHQASGRRVP